ncbi:VanZ family protein [Bacillus mesophilus]|uniref:VanZ family protein n=1 Tax=Bacillus mesophilus TaxID=1808955 RepID=A0A6M0Q8Z9_9BACI|nr:VanZ family protein [Bacillus mesophilus]MBM7662520.1 VanZ family protein [Bacillus mesophilus]NEY72856.1 VanZ family protein [Bacillus mesophilus]
MRQFTYWIPVIVIAGIIFWFSSQPYQEQDVKPFLSDFINEQWVKVTFDWVQFDYAGYLVSVEALGASSFIEFFIRKGAHFGVFFVLGFFTIRASLLTFLNTRPVTGFITSFLFVILYGVSDELHQHFTGDRTPLIHDVMIDSVGGLVGIIIYMLLFGRKK